MEILALAPRHLHAENKNGWACANNAIHSTRPFCMLWIAVDLNHMRTPPESDSASSDLVALQRAGWRQLQHPPRGVDNGLRWS